MGLTKKLSILQYAYFLVLTELRAESAEFPTEIRCLRERPVLVEFNTSALNTETPWPVAPFTPALDYWNSPGMLLHSFVLEI